MHIIIIIISPSIHRRLIFPSPSYTTNVYLKGQTDRREGSCKTYHRRILKGTERETRERGVKKDVKSEDQKGEDWTKAKAWNFLRFGVIKDIKDVER